MHGHTGGGLTLERGFPISVSTKQKLNTRSSTESELVRVDDMMPIICWTHYFLLSQGYGIIENLLLQDNRSSILLEQNRRASSGKRTRHINIRIFFITDRVDMKEISIDWCSTKKMVADYMTKPLQGSLFREFRDYIMGRVRCIRPKTDVASLGQKKVCKKLIKKSKVNDKRRITVTGSKKCPKVMTQKYCYHCVTGVCWGLYAGHDCKMRTCMHFVLYRMVDGRTVAQSIFSLKIQGVDLFLSQEISSFSHHSFTNDK